MSLLAIPSGTSSNAGGFYPYEIDGSLRFNDDDSAYLSRTPASASNRKTWTWSGWVKRGNLGIQSSVFGAVNSSFSDRLRFNTNDTLVFYGEEAVDFTLQTSQVFRDPSAWYHIIIAMDTTQATASDRLKFYINGEQVTDFSSESYPSLNRDGGMNNTSAHHIGQRPPSNAQYLDGYLAEVNFIDGTALDPTSFGETKSGVWVPKAYSGSYGTNGFHLEFAGNANDSSGNGNNWTANNISSYDYVPDSPTNNFATLNPLDTNVTLAQGNLQAVDIGSFNDAPASFGMTSGKWYCEGYALDMQISVIGITGLSNSGKDHSAVDSLRTIYEDDGVIRREGTGVSNTSGLATYTTGDIIGVALDVDAGTIAFYKNGSLINSTTNSVYSSNEWKFYVGVGGGSDWVLNFGQDSSFLGNETAQGNTDDNGVGDFYYSPPSGYLALCTANLTVPEAIDPAEDNSPQDYFDVALWTGTSEVLSINDLTFQPDFVWIKERSSTSQHGLMDAVRGANKTLFSDATTEEFSYTGEVAWITSFDSDGFTVGADNNGSNQLNQTYVAWNWKANGSGVSNTDGTITSTVSANTDAGFSIVSWAGNSTAGATIGHGLTSAPEMVIVKARNKTGESWLTYHKGVASDAETDYLQLNSTASAQDNSNVWNDTAPSSTVFTVGSDSGVNGSTYNYIAYCFHSVEGFSKFGSYTGGSSPLFAYTGFRPAFVLIKRATTGTSDWILFDDKRDGYNGSLTRLYPNEPDAESAFNANRQVQFMANGFEVTGAPGAGDDGNRLLESGTYIFIAFAANPFKYSTAF